MKLVEHAVTASGLSYGVESATQHRGELVVADVVAAQAVSEENLAFVQKCGSDDVGESGPGDRPIARGRIVWDRHGKGVAEPAIEGLAGKCELRFDDQTSSVQVEDADRSVGLEMPACTGLLHSETALGLEGTQAGEVAWGEQVVVDLGGSVLVKPNLETVTHRELLSWW